MNGNEQSPLSRFLTAQSAAYPIALAEMKNGRKYSHWIWYIFPQLKGLGHSWNSEYYGINGRSEAEAYLAHPVLGNRLREITEVVLKIEGKSIEEIMSSRIDARKFHSSMTLFDAVSPDDIFAETLKKYFGGRRDGNTLRMLEKN